MFKYKKTYKFAFYSASVLSLFAFFLMLILHFVFYKDISINIFADALFLSGLFIFSFVVIQYRVEKFIYKRIQKIYKEVSVLNIGEFDKNSITTNMETLSKNVKLFADKKFQEIENLKEREDYRREFLGNISHELKTPLFTVQGYLLTLLEGAVDNKDIRLKYLERANNGVERLNHIVKDLDLIAKLETGDLNLEFTNFDIVELTNNVFELLEINAKKKNITLLFDKVYESKILVKADKSRLEQVLLNLIANGIYYGNNNGFVKVEFKATDFKTMEVYVSDNGDGIPENSIHRVFERFYRAEKSRTRNQGGSGLGLSIVKHILEAHKQKISVESEYGKGSTFTFTLDLV